MAYLFHNSLGNFGRFEIADSFIYTGCSLPDDPSCLTNAGPFKNIQASDYLDIYWSDTEYKDTDSAAWTFTFYSGTQTAANKVNLRFAWPVIDGDVFATVGTPVADAGPSTSVDLNDMVQLDGSGSYDMEGDSLTFAWEIISMPTGSVAILSVTNAVTPLFTADTPGTYEIQLFVNDGTINSAPDSVIISTNNIAPVADAGLDVAANLYEFAYLDGSGSSDMDGDTLTYVWSFLSKPAGSQAVILESTYVNARFRADLSGEYVVQLVVNDGALSSVADTAVI